MRTDKNKLSRTLSESIVKAIESMTISEITEASRFARRENIIAEDGQKQAMTEFKKDQALSNSDKQLNGYFVGEYYTGIGDYGFGAGEFTFHGKHIDMIKFLNMMNNEGYLEYPDLSYDEFYEHCDDFKSEEECRQYYDQHPPEVIWNYKFTGDQIPNDFEELELQRLYDFFTD